MTNQSTIVRQWGDDATTISVGAVDPGTYALAVRNEEKGGATYPLEPREQPFRDVGVRVTVVWPGEPNALYDSEGAQEGFLVLSEIGAADGLVTRPGRRLTSLLAARHA